VGHGERTDLPTLVQPSCERRGLFVGAGLVERRVGGARVDGRRGLFSNDVRHGGDALGGREREQ
jgi:hypothetical protein